MKLFIVLYFLLALFLHLYYLLIDLFIKQIKTKHFSWVREGSQLSEQLTALDCYTKGYCFSWSVHLFVNMI